MRRMMFAWRLRRGLRWKAARPAPRDLGINATSVPMLLFVLACYGVAGSLEYATERRIEAERQTQRADAQRDALLACLNVGAQGLYTTDTKGRRHYIVCASPFVVSDENVKARR